MDFVTIHVNRRFLVVTAILAFYAASSFGVYKLGYNKGLSDMAQYVQQMFQGQKSEA